MKKLSVPIRPALELLGCVALVTLSSACVGENPDGDRDGAGDENTAEVAEPVVAGLDGISQAESPTFQSGCTQSATPAGFTGTGFMHCVGKGAIVEWNNVNVASPGPYTLTFRYANAGASALPCSVTVNDDLASPAPVVQFNPTGAATTYSNTAAVTVNLKAGNNKVRITTNTTSGGPSLDRMDVRSRTQCVEKPEGSSAATLACPGGQVIGSVDFASFGTPTGTCGGGFSASACNAATSLSKVKAACLGKSSCSVLPNTSVFGDPCAGVAKELDVKYTCSDAPSVSVQPWAACLQLYPSGPAQPPSGGVVRDHWGRNIDARGLLMVDWEGAMGNPETTIQVSAPPGMKFPVKMFVSVPNAPLVYLDAWSGVQDATGPHTTKAIELFTAQQVETFTIGVNPDRDFTSETYAVHLDFTGSDGVKKAVDVPLRVCDQDIPRSNDFKFTRKVLDTYGDGWLNGQGAAWDYNEDGIHDGVQSKKLMSQIIDDIEYYLAPLDVDTVPVGQASTPVSWDPAAVIPGLYHNTEAFNGFNLVTTLGLGSTGLPGFELDTRDGAPTQHRSSGVILIDRQLPPEWKSTNHVDGWHFQDGVSKDWWRSSRWQDGPSPTGDCPAGVATCSFYPTSFYSVMKHELLHTLAFSQGWPKWKHFADVGCIDDPAVMAHTGHCTPVSGDGSHAWDPQLHKRAWDHGIELIDDFEVLVLQAVGWKLRDTTPLVKLQVTGAAWPQGTVGSPYGFSTPVRGGVPAYRFQLTGGALPPGLALDSFTGKLAGTPTQAGTYNMTIQVADSGISVPVVKSVSVVVK